ncbi:MAG: phosphodiester glycosidase family protein [Acidimicrobiales bacterium]
MALALVLILSLLVGVSLVGAAATPGNQAFKAKWADWLRSHDGGFVVVPLERWYYSMQAPPKGGRPRALNRVPPSGKATTATAPAGRHLPPPKPVPLVVSDPLPGEGQWQPTGPLVDGRYGMYVAQFRADTVYTSQITTAVWIDPTLLRIGLVPGAHQPGGIWNQPPDLLGAAAAKAVAAFNGGFRTQDAQGGFYLDGRTAVPLRPAAASVVIYKNGRVDIGAWGSQVGMTPNVQAVLQNLVLLVDNGQISPTATYTDNQIWGATLGASTVVARSGIGITANGAVVYVAGPALTVKTLAEALQRAGAVRAMTLDINPEWVTFNFFTHPDPANPGVIQASKLYPQMQRPATRYLGPTPESRDFFTVSTG